VEVPERRGIGKVVQPVVLGAQQRKARHQTGELPAPAPLALGVDLLASPQRQDRSLPPTIAAAVFVDRHRRIITRGNYRTTPPHHPPTKGGAVGAARGFAAGERRGSGGIGGAQRPKGASTARAPGSFSSFGREASLA